MNPLIRIIPPPLVRFFARPYVAGESLRKAMDAAADLWSSRGLMSTLDLLAEGIDSDTEVRKNIDTYLEMLAAVSGDPRFPQSSRPTVSLKPSSYTTDPLDKGGAAKGSAAAIREIVGSARRHGVDVTIDMEDRRWTDFTLNLLAELHADGHDHVGGVLQTRLHRTEQDLDRLPAGMRVRLVIGIYREPSDFAIHDKREMKERLLRYAERLLSAGHYVEFATHDQEYVERFMEDVVRRGNIGTDRFEVQMLFGVPRTKLLQRLVDEGCRCRLYVPFAVGWSMAIAYLRRRLDEYPAMSLLVMKNMFRRG